MDERLADVLRWLAKRAAVLLVLAGCGSPAGPVVVVEEVIETAPVRVCMAADTVGELIRCKEWSDG